MADLVTMTHHRLGERAVPRTSVRKMRQNGWSVKPAPPRKKTSSESKEESD